MRYVLSRLEEDGLIARRPGRGTIVCRRESPAVLIADDEAAIRALLRRHVERAGYAVLEAATPDAALARLESEPDIALVLSDIHMPDAEGGVAFIRTVRRRWPELPLAAVTGFPEDLAALHGTDEYPVLTIPKPFRSHQIDEALRLGLGARRPPASVRAGVVG
jgi:CheY-like chemotaxis protein